MTIYILFSVIFILFVLLLEYKKEKEINVEIIKHLSEIIDYRKNWLKPKGFDYKIGGIDISPPSPDGWEERNLISLAARLEKAAREITAFVSQAGAIDGGLDVPPLKIENIRGTFFFRTKAEEKKTNEQQWFNRCCGTVTWGGPCQCCGGGLSSPVD